MSLNTFSAGGIKKNCIIGTSVCNDVAAHINVLADPAWTAADDFGRGDIVMEYLVGGEVSYKVWDGVSAPFAIAASVHGTNGQPATVDTKKDIYASGSSYPVAFMSPAMQALVQANQAVLIAAGWTLEMSGTTVVSITSA